MDEPSLSRTMAKQWMGYRDDADDQGKDKDGGFIGLQVSKASLDSLVALLDQRALLEAHPSMRSLSNVRGLVARGLARKEPRLSVEEMEHLLRFCKEGGVEGSILREERVPVLCYGCGGPHAGTACPGPADAVPRAVPQMTFDAAAVDGVTLLDGKETGVLDGKAIEGAVYERVMAWARGGYQGPAPEEWLNFHRRRCPNVERKIPLCGQMMKRGFGGPWDAGHEAMERADPEILARFLGKNCFEVFLQIVRPAEAP